METIPSTSFNKQTVKYGWETDKLAQPKRLKTFASKVKHPGGNTLLHRFVLENSDPNVSGSASYINAVLLCMFDISVNELNSEGYSALHLAVLRRNLLMVQKLLSCLENIIDVNARCNVGGNTALHLAAKLGYAPIIQELLHKGADIDEGNYKEDTAICLAAESGYLDILKLLVSKGANVHLMGKGGSLLHCAVRSGDLVTVQFLVSHGAHVCGKTPPYQAFYSGNEYCAEILEGRDSYEHVEGKESLTLLHDAVYKEHVECSAFLEGLGADLHAEDAEGKTPLCDAVRGGHG